MSMLASLVAALTGFAPVVAAATPTTFVQTNTLGYTAAEYTDEGLAPVTMPLHVIVGLAPRNAGAIDTLLARMATPGDPLNGTALSAEQTTAMFGQTAANVQSVVTYLQSSGFRNVAASPDRLLVSATGTVALAQAAFDTRIDTVLVGGRTTFANVVPAYVPSSLGGIVVAVEGLSGVTMHGDRRTPVAPGCTAVAVVGRCVAGPLAGAALRSFYHAAATASASRTTLAVLAAGSLGSLAHDTATAAAAAGIPPAPLITVATGPASGDTSLLPEWDADAQAALAVAGGASRLVVYDAAALDEAGVTADLDRFETDATAAAAVASFGICEDVASTDGSMLVDDTLLALAALHGQTLFAATGSAHAACAGQQFPASSPYAIAVGATTVIAANGTQAAEEVAWTATSGGPSSFESARSWQAPLEPAAAGATGARALPDLALDGDPNTGFPALVAGSWTVGGGTSLGAALALGIWGRLESAHGNALGFAAPRLYREYADLRTAANTTPPAGTVQQQIGGFRDLLVGVTGLPAAPEDDFATGLGSLDIALQQADILR